VELVQVFIVSRATDTVKVGAYLNIPVFIEGSDELLLQWQRWEFQHL